MATQTIHCLPTQKEAAISPKLPLSESIMRREGKAQVRMLHGIQISPSQKLRIAEILHERWGRKEGKGLERYAYEMNCRAQNAFTPFFMAEFEGRIEGAVFPIRTSNPARKWEDLNSGGTWKNDDPAGSTMLCCQIAVCKDARSKGTARSLVVDGVLPLARDLYLGGWINRLLAFSRPANYGAYSSRMGIEEYLRTTINRNNGSESQEGQMKAYGRYLERIDQIPAKFPLSMGQFFRDTGRLHIDSTMGMHLWFGAKITEIIENGCPMDKAAGGYLIVMDYSHLLQSGLGNAQPGK